MCKNTSYILSKFKISTVDKIYNIPLHFCFKIAISPAFEDKER